MPAVTKVECDLGEDSYLLLDSPGMIEQECNRLNIRDYRNGGGSSKWYGSITFTEALRRTHTGDMALVKRSDELLSKLEDQIVHTRKWRVIEDVVGSLPNVPAYLAGNPINMRRRVKVDRDDAPVSIFMDLTSSAGISGEQLLARGVAILAFTRLLVEHRAVELWSGIALGEGSWRRGPWSSTVAWKIDTAPLDLARAAHLLCSPGVARGLGYALASECVGHSDWNGDWSFGRHSEHIKTHPERLQRALGNRELLYVPPIYLTDPLVTAPVEWIKRELARYTGQSEQDDAA